MLDRHPFDVVGWDGYVWPYTFNADDFEPRAGRFHLPPPAHQTFQGQNFVICTFAPRMLDWDPEAVPLPYHHSNIQSEEVMFYAEGDYAARKGVEVGSHHAASLGAAARARSPAPSRRRSARRAPTSWRHVGHLPAAAADRRSGASTTSPSTRSPGTPTARRSRRAEAMFEEAQLYSPVTRGRGRRGGPPGRRPPRRQRPRVPRPPRGDRRGRAALAAGRAGAGDRVHRGASRRCGAPSAASWRRSTSATPAAPTARRSRRSACRATASRSSRRSAPRSSR